MRSNIDSSLLIVWVSSLVINVVSAMRAHRWCRWGGAVVSSQATSHLMSLLVFTSDSSLRPMENTLHHFCNILEIHIAGAILCQKSFLVTSLPKNNTPFITWTSCKYWWESQLCVGSGIYPYPEVLRPNYRENKYFSIFEVYFQVHADVKQNAKSNLMTMNETKTN